MPALGYSGSVSLSTTIKGKPRKEPIWEFRYRRPGGASDRSLGKAWIDLDLWRTRGKVSELQSRPKDGYMTRSQAEIAAEAFLNELANVAPQARRTLHEACQAFVQGKKRAKVNGSTHYGYGSYARMLCKRSWRGTERKWGDQVLSQITPQDVTRLHEAMVDEGYSVSSLNHFGHMVRGAFGRDSAQAKAWPWSRDTQKASGRIRYYTPDQVRLLKERGARSEEERAIYTIATEQGLRRSEIIALKRTDVDFGAQVLRVEDGFTRAGGIGDTKGHQARSIPMTRNTARMLAPLVEGKPQHDSEGEPLLLFSRDGFGRLTLDPDTVSKSFYKARKRAGLPKLTFHELRHTFGTQAMASGRIDVYTLQRLMGHQEITTTQKYLHFAPRPDLGDALSAIWENEQGADVIPIRKAS